MARCDAVRSLNMIADRCAYRQLYMVDMLHAFVHTALCDYTRDERGDVGRVVREVAVKGMCVFKLNITHVYSYC
jgi:hypothetical protein